MNAPRALVRVEWRDLRRHRGRSLLVLLLVAVPVAALSGAGALVRSMRPTDVERRAERFGAAELRVESHGGREFALVREALAGAPSTAVGLDLVRLVAGGTALQVPAHCTADGGLGLAVGGFRLGDGRPPHAEREVALSRAVLAGLGITLGDRVAVDGVDHTVVGTLVAPERLDAPLLWRRGAPSESRRALWLAATDGAAATDRAAASGGAPGPLGRDTPNAAADAAALDALAARIEERLGRAPERADRMPPSDDFESLALFVVGGLGFVEAALVVAAAFAVGLRRRQRELGLLAAGGAPPRLLARGLLASPALLALIGGVLGLAVGLAAALALEPFVDGWNGRENGSVVPSVPHTLGALALGLASAVGAAAIPVRTALRLPVTVALSGRRPAPAGSGRWMALGLALILLGLGAIVGGTALESAATPVAILAGSVAGVLGLGCTSPWWLERAMSAARRLPPAWRLAVRDAGRFRTRNAPVVTAVLAGLATSVLLGSLLDSVRGMVDGRLPLLAADQLRLDGPGAEQVAAELVERFGGVAAPLPIATRAGVPVLARARRSDGSQLATIAHVASPELLAALGADLGPEGSDHAVHLPAPGPTDPETGATLAVGGLWAPGFERALGAAESDASAAPPLPVARFRVAEPTRSVVALVPTALAAELGLEPSPPPGATVVPWLVRLRAPVDRARFDAARAAAAAIPGTSVDAELLRASAGRGALWFALALSFGTGLIVVFIATALSAVESASDARVLASLGAPPALLHGTQGARAAWLALVGAALAVPGGLLPSFGLVALSDVPLEFAIPWRVIALSLFGLPALAWTGAWLASRFRPYARGRALVADPSA